MTNLDLKKQFIAIVKQLDAMNKEYALNMPVKVEIQWKKKNRIFT